MTTATGRTTPEPAEEELVPLTRVEIARHAAAAFEDGPAKKSELLAAASDAGARTEVLHALHRLPDRTYGHLREIWNELPEVPVEL